MDRRQSIAMRFLLTLLVLLSASACGGSSTAKDDDATTDAGGPVVGLDCFEDPQTHEEIINACTGPEVVKVAKNPILPKLLPDGSLPPLP